MKFTEKQQIELNIRKAVEEGVVGFSREDAVLLLRAIDNLRDILRVEGTERLTEAKLAKHWNSSDQLPPVSDDESSSLSGPWLRIKTDKTKIFGEDSYVVRRTSAVKDGPRNVWTVEDEEGTVDTVKVVEWQYV